MPEILSSDVHHSVIWKKCGTPWISLCFMLSGTYSIVTVHQTPVLVTSLSHDVTLQCELTHSPDEKMVRKPVLYWEFVNSDKPGNWPRLWPSTEPYGGRVDRLDNDLTSQNKSIRFRNVQWEDSGTYQCKLSISTERRGSERLTGEGTRLRVYDTMFFNTTAEDDTQLRCAVNVSWDPGFGLSVSHGGLNQLSDPVPREKASALPYVTLVQTIPLRDRGQYECQLHLNTTLIHEETFYYNPAAPGEMKVYPQPWLLYMGILLVPVTVLLALATALLLEKLR